MRIKNILLKLKFNQTRSRIKKIIDNKNFRKIIKKNKIKEIIYQYKFKDVAKKDKLGEIIRKDKFRKLLNKEKFSDILTHFRFKEINPENAILIFYLFSGLFLSIIIYFALNIPLSGYQKKLKEEVKSYQLKKKNIPNIKSQFKVIENKAKILKDDRNFLVNLIAGNKNLDTLMTVLNEKANRNFVNITKFEPQNVEKFIPKKTLINESLENNGPPTIINKNVSLPPSTTTSSLPSDNNLEIKLDKNPLLIIPNIEKHEIKLSIEGNYTQVLSFIRDVELLENIVLIGDFEIIGLDDLSKTNDIIVRYEANISAFGNIINPPEKKQNI